MSLSLWNDPWTELRGLQRDLDRMFSSTLAVPQEGGELSGTTRRWIPAFDVRETDRDLVVTADLPGNGPRYYGRCHGAFIGHGHGPGR
jgi:HSP20 family molecular chaperone IbpA